MRMIITVTALFCTVLFANSAEEIYKTKCASCHKIQMPKMQMMGMMKNGNMAMMQNMIKENNMSAPPMPMVAKRLKMKLKTKEEFIRFVDDYIQNPSQKKGLCMPMAYKRFGTMPPIGKSMTKEERLAVANWLYENFKGSWKPNGTMCQMKMKNQSKK